MLVVTSLWLMGAGVVALAFESTPAAVTLWIIGIALINHAT